ncbi:MAG: hypothetical protein U1F49_18620 [Rubrivivax sp.]
MKVYYDKDADLSLIKGKQVTIVGYGSRPRARAEPQRQRRQGDGGPAPRPRQLAQGGEGRPPRWPR